MTPPPADAPCPAALPIAWHRIDTLFLDAGNTLLHWDGAFVAEVLAGLGLESDAACVERAEAACRGRLSRVVSSGHSTESDAARVAYVSGVLGAAVRGFAARPREEQGRLVAAVVRALRTPEGQERLWSRVPPGVPEALAALRADGVRLVVVSNSDGTCEAKLAAAGLREVLDAVVDSHLVGAEKPDPAIFHHALSRTGAHPGRTLHAGDLHHADVVGAARAGLPAVLLDPFDDWRDAACERAADVPSLAVRLLAARRLAGAGV